MKRLLLLLFIFFSSISITLASHIVGGELELTHVRGNTYILRLNIYHDDINGARNPQTGEPYAAIDETSYVSVFRKSDNSRIGTYALQKDGFSMIPYTNIECEDSKLVTSKHTYSASINLLPEIFNHAGGYYAAWERCCRNGVIQNINIPGETGTVFYMEFPAVVRNNEVFRNSSPRLFPPLSDYACLNKPFTFDFSGSDADDDSLVYSLTIPLRGATEATNNPPLCCPGAAGASAAPYRTVQWAPGYSTALQVQGSQPLTIDSKTGLLQVTPDRTGLFVFSVKCEEFRKGIKIGEVRRDFQLFVVDCPVNDPPRVSMMNPETGNLYTEGDTLYLKREDLCLKFKIADPDVEEKLTIQAIPLNFTPGAPLLSGGNTATGIVNSSTNPTDSLQYELCLEPCLTRNGEAYRISLLGKDNACSVPQSARLNLIVIVEPDPNDPPLVQVANQSDTVTVRVGDRLTLAAKGTDPNLDLVTLMAKGEGFQLSEKGMAFPERTGTGEVDGQLTWTVPCSAFGNEVLKVNFIAQDQGCGLSSSDTVSVWFRVEHSDLPAAISTDLTEHNGPYRVQVQAGTSISFNLFGNDQDTTRMQLTAKGVNFDLTDYDMQFSGANGTRTITSPFIFAPGCDIGELPELEVAFTLTEFACPQARTETILVTFEVIDTVRKDIEPYNVVTPNGDGKNEYFSLEGVPVYDCMGEFDFVEIYNRWGNLVFRERSSDFRWDASPFSIGSYYYYIKFDNKAFKGWVTVLK